MDLPNRLRGLERIANRLDTFLAYLDTDLRYIYANAQYGRWFNREGDLAGHHVKDVVGRERWREVEVLYRKVLRGESVRFVHEFQAASGAMGWGKVDFVPDYDDDGAVCGVLVQVSNVTELKETEQRLREVQEDLERRVADRTVELRAQGEHLRAVTDAVPAGIAYFDQDGLCGFCNRTFAQWFHASTEDLVGRRLAELLPRATPRSFLDECAGGLATSIEIELNTAPLEAADPQRRRTLELHAVPQNPSNPGSGITLLAYDLTQRNIEQQHHRRVHMEMVESQRLKSLGLLTRGLAHDFTNLLHAITGNLDLAQKLLEEGSPATPLLERAENAARQAREFCSELLAYSGKASTQRSQVDLPQLTREMVELVRSQPEHDTVIEIELAEDIAPVSVNPTQIKQVLMNLLMNSVQASGASNRITVSLETVTLTEPLEVRPRQLPAGPYVACTVRDTGIGMDVRTSERLFEPFFTTKSEGRGLGLAAVLGIVEGHGGGIEVDSAIGGGTTIRVLLPVQRGALAAAPEQEEPSWRGSGLALVVDDDRLVLEVSAESLRQFGFDVVCASSGQEALDVIDLHPELRLVVLDLMMPGMDGHETVARLRGLRPDLPVIINSGFPTQARPLLEQPRTELLQKPWFPEDLRNAARRLDEVEAEDLPLAQSVR